MRKFPKAVTVGAGLGNLKDISRLPRRHPIAYTLITRARRNKPNGDKMTEQELSYDDLMARYKEIKDKNAELETKIESYDEKIGKMQESLDSARALNTKLMFDDTSVKDNYSPMEPKADPKQETMDEFIDSFNKEAIKIVNRKYGEMIYNDDN